MAEPTEQPLESAPTAAEVVRVSKTMAFLLRHRPDVGNLDLDDAGWVSLDDLCAAVARLLRADVALTHVKAVLAASDVRRFEIAGGRIRAVHRLGTRDGAPDILYLATTAPQIEGYLVREALADPRGRPLLMSEEESSAWRVAHRLGGNARVLYVDTARALRQGVRFERNRRTGLFMADEVPAAVVLNLLPNFAEQFSAGGVPVQRGSDGRPRMALIRVARRSGVTWEVAKGKLEPGEPPERAALREVREEMGLEAPLRIRSFVGPVRYGFLAPGGLPRLKTIYLYLMDSDEPVGNEFSPSEREGIGEVRWFTPTQACRAVTHTSLIPMMRRAKQLAIQTSFTEP